jgi:biopolymer transport protein ExbD
MRQRYRRDLLVEPPSVATGDIAFNLIIFFLVCASTQPDNGRAQVLPRAEQNKTKQEAQNVEVTLTRDAFLLDGAPVRDADLEKRLRSKLSAKPSPSERIVILKSDKATPYHHWIRATIAIEAAGGIITMQREETKVQAAP